VRKNASYAFLFLLRFFDRLGMYMPNISLRVGPRVSFAYFRQRRALFGNRNEFVGARLTKIKRRTKIFSAPNCHRLKRRCICKEVWEAGTGCDRQAEKYSRWEDFCDRQRSRLEFQANPLKPAPFVTRKNVNKREGAQTVACTILEGSTVRLSVPH
jgi:hypothetical protein